MYRLFVAINFPSLVNEELLALGGGVPGARWMEVDQLHLTLRFIGGVDGARFREIREALRQVRLSPFSLVLKDVGHFPPRGEPRLLWVGVEKNEALFLLHEKVENALVRLGLPPEPRKFSPHLTIARLKGGRRVGEFIQAHSLFKTESFPVEEFHLYSSSLSPKGSHYRIEVSYPL